MPGGRPTDYTEDMGDLICEGIAQGLSLVKICTNESMPGLRTVYAWRRKHEVFQHNYARAREDAADLFVQEILEIADQAENENIQVAKLRTDVRKWTAARFNRAYQDKTISEHTGPNGNPLTLLLQQISGNTLEPSD